MAKSNIWKQKYEAAQKRLSSALKRSASGTKTMGIGVGAGAAARYAVDLAADKVGFIRENWWGKGAAIGAVALLVRKKNRDAAIALAGAAGYALADAYKNQEGGDSQGYYG